MTKFTEKRITAEIIEEVANYIERQAQYAIEAFDNFADDSSLADWEKESKAETKARIDAYAKLLTALEKI